MAQDISAGWLALLYTTAGAAGLKLVDTLLARWNKRPDEMTAWRKELREERDLKKREADDYRTKYYVLQERYNMLTVQTMVLLHAIRDMGGDLPEEMRPLWEDLSQFSPIAGEKDLEVGDDG